MIPYFSVYKLRTTINNATCMSRMYSYRLASVAVAALCIGACGVDPILKHTPGKTYGRIIVGSPKINTRESLVNDRLTEGKLLKEILSASMSEEFGIQGRSVLRDFRGVAAGLALEVGPQVEAINQSQKNLTNFLKGQGNIQQQQQDLAQTQLDLQKQSLANLEAWLQLPENKRFVIDPSTGKLIDLSKGEAGTQVTQTGAPTAPSASTLQFPSTSPQLTNLGNQANLLPSVQFPTTPGVQSSPVDRFRDRLAYRQEIRNEILDNQLDDRHDLNGHALYRLKFETHVIPESDTSAWAVVEVEPMSATFHLPIYCTIDAPKDDCKYLISLYTNWTKQIEDAAQDRIDNEAARISDTNSISQMDPSLRARVFEIYKVTGNQPAFLLTPAERARPSAVDCRRRVASTAAG
jgi:hypothetical protein